MNTSLVGSYDLPLLLQDSNRTNGLFDIMAFDLGMSQTMI